jgi:hypothetical protein
MFQSNVSYYYQQAAAIADAYERTCLAGTAPNGQPPPSTVFDPQTGQRVLRCTELFVTSIKHISDPQSFGGATCAVTLVHGSRVIASGSHRIATSEEISAWKQHQIDNKIQSDAADAKLADVRKFVVKPFNPATV